MSFQRDFLAKRLRDPQAKFIHDLAQQQLNDAADNNNVVTSNIKGYSLKPKTKTTSKDKFYANIKPYSDDIVFYTGQYPDRDNCRLYLCIENAGDLHDYSLRNNKAYCYGTRQVPEIFIKEEPNTLIEHEVISYFNGTHYVIVKDHPMLRLTDIVANEVGKIGFTIVKRFTPLLFGNSTQDSIILAQKTDSSSNRYGYSINMDNLGNIYFYVKFNHRQYFCKLENAFDTSFLSGDYFFENFKSKNYKTDLADLLENIENNTLFDLSCQFTFATKECKIQLRYKNTTLLESSSTNQNIPNTQINMPLQEGEWSDTEDVKLNQVYDSSPNQFIGTIVHPATPTIEWQDNNTFHNTRTAAGVYNGSYISIPNHANLNNLTEFTIAFWVKVDDLLCDVEYREFFNKGWQTEGSFVVYREPGTKMVFVAIRQDGANHWVGIDNAFSNTTDYHLVVCKWKSGENVKISVNNAADVLSPTTLTGTLTNSTALRIHNVTSDSATIIDFMFFNRQITALEQTKIYNFGPHLAQFPKNLEPQQTPDATPDPVTNPFAILYNLNRITTPGVGDYTFINDVSAETPFTPKYTCAEGTGVGIPADVRMNVPIGITVEGVDNSGNWSLVSSDNSHLLFGNSSSENIRGGFQIIAADHPAIGKPLKKVHFWIKKNDGGENETIACKVWSSNSGLTSFADKISVGTKNASGLTSAYTEQIFENASNTVTLALYDIIGIEYSTSDADHQISVQRRAADAEGWVVQVSHDTGGSGFNDNPSFDIRTMLEWGSTTPPQTPYLQLQNGTGKITTGGEIFNSGCNLINGIPNKIEICVGRNSSATAGTYSVKHLKADGTDKATLISGVAVNSLPLIPVTTLNIVWTNNDYVHPILAGERIVLIITGVPAAGIVYLYNNLGNTTGNNGDGTPKNYHGSSSYLVSRISSWTTYPTLDMSCKITIGGYTFVPYKRFSNTITRVGERCVDLNSSFYGQQITSATPKARRTGTIPGTPTMACNIRRLSDNTVVQSLGSIDANTIPEGSAFVNIGPFTNIVSQYVLQANDYICFDLSGCDASNYIDININLDVVDTSKSYLVQLNSGVIENLAQFDLAGTFETGGQIDTVSRIRVGQYINTQESLFVNTEDNKIHEITFWAYRTTTSTTGILFVNIRTGEGDSAIKNLGQYPVGSLSTNPASPTLVKLTDLTNSYVLDVKDKILIEFEGGNQTNKVGIMIRTVVPDYDGSASHIAKFNGATYDYDTTKDLCALIRTGGDTYTPDPNEAPPIMPQLSTDLYIGVRGDKTSKPIKAIEGMFLFTTEILTNQQLDALYYTRIDIADNAPNEILTTNYTFIKQQ